ncbi:MAG: Eco57I restriction-modification methylase domain-containing protein, partial [Dehalococcoidia bacterium]
MTTNTTRHTTGDEGIPVSIRRAIRRTVLDLRARLEEDFRRQLASLAIDERGVHPSPSGRALRPEQERARAVAGAVLAREMAGGARPEEAFAFYLGECAYSFINWVYGFRCLEERNLLLVDGRSETLIRIDLSLGSSSLYWRARNELGRSTAPRDLWRHAFRRACEAVSQQVRLLFDPDSEYAALFPLLPTVQAAVEALNAPEILPQTYAQDELLGWVYQYFNATRKDEIFAAAAKGKKIAGADIVPVTQLYTERYMVDFLLQNSLGALWMEQHPDSTLWQRWPYYVRVSGLGSRVSDDEHQASIETLIVVPPSPERERAGVRGEPQAEAPPQAITATPELSRPSPEPRDPKPVRNLTILDPACGSGHFLLRAADMLAAMYLEEGIEPPDQIPRLILERNLYGIDIDLRAVQIAALALYMKVATLAGGTMQPRRLNLVPADAQLNGGGERDAGRGTRGAAAAKPPRTQPSPVGAGFKPARPEPSDGPPAEYLARFQGDTEMLALVRGIWQGLRNVRELGSLLHPERAIDEVAARRRARDRGSMWEHDDAHWARWKADLLDGLREEFERQAGAEDLGRRLFGEQAARGVGLVELLSTKYDVVCANPPYMGS